MKKFLTGSLTVMTIVWAMGLSAFVAVPASAAVGDLVKSASSSTVYVVKADGVTICQFPHANVYRSWGYPATFATVMTKDLSSYTVGSNIEFRDASLVKGDGPAVYMVYNNMKRPIISDVVFLGLGYDWDKITWLSDAFLADYTTGAVVDSSTMHPDGQIVKYAGSPAVYLIDNGMKRPFASGAAFEANRYSWGDIITIPDTETYPNGSPVSGYEQALSLPTCIGTSATPAGSGLTVALSPSTPAAGSIIVDSDGGQALVPFTTINFTASSDGDVKVTGLILKRTGISSDSALDNMYLYDGNTKLTDGGSLSSGMVSFNSANGLFTVPAGTTKSITVKGDVSTTASAGQTLGFQLLSSGNVSTNGASVMGSFPATGNLMTIASVTDLGQFGMSTTSVAATVNPDTMDQVVWQGTAYTTNQTMALHYIKFTSLGSIQVDDLANFKLYDGGTLVSTVASMTNDRELIFDLSGSPVNFTLGQSKTFKVFADIVKGSTRTYNFTIQEATDIVAKDTNYNVFVTPTVGSGYASWTVLKMTTDTEILAGTLSINRATTSPTGNVSQNGTNVKVATFDFKAVGEDAKVKNLNVMANFTSGTTVGLDNGKVYFNGNQVGSTKDLTEDTPINFTFGSSLVVPAGTTGVIDIYADIRTTAGATIANGSDFTVSLEAGSSNVQLGSSLGYLSSPSGQIAGNSLNVSSASLSVAKYASYGNQTMVAGVQMAKLGSAVVTAGSAEGVNLTSVTVSTTALMAASTTNMYLMEGGVQLGTTKVTPGASNIFSVNLNIPASGSKVIDIFANINPGADAGNLIFGLAAEGVGMTTNGTVNGTEAVLQTIAVSTGSLTYVIGSARPDANIVVAGTNKQLMNAVDFSASYEDFAVSELTVSTTSGFAGDVGQIYLEYPKQDGTTETKTAYIGGTTATFTGLNFYVPAGTTKTLKIYADISTINTTSNNSGDTGNLTLAANQTFRATGVSSGTVDTDPTTGGSVTGLSDINGNTMVLRKTVPTITLVNLPTATLINGTPVLSKFTVTADAAGDVGLYKIAFEVATSGAAMTIGVPALYDSSTNALITASTTPTTAVAGPGYWTLTYVFASEQVITAGTSKGFYMKAAVTGSDGNDALLTKINASGDTPGTTGIYSAITPDSFVWSDHSSSPHNSFFSSDWADSNYVKTLPTDYQTVSNN